MYKSAGSLNVMGFPLRAWIQRFAFALLLFVSIALITLDKMGHPVLISARMTVVESVAPVIETLSVPVTLLNNVIETAQNYVALKSENEYLRRRNAALRGWQIKAAQLESENDALRRLLNTPSHDVTREGFQRSVTARVIIDQGGNFVRSVIVQAGDRDGIRKGQTAMGSQGVAGRVSDVGRRTSRVVLITDTSSRIPVLVGPGRHRAILAGDNSPLLRLNYLEKGVQLSKGDLVHTSGHGRAFAPGLPIGTVAGLRDGIVRVIPFAMTDDMDFLRLDDYGLSFRLDLLDSGQGANGGSTK